MLTVNIIAVGKLKEKFYQDACGEYAKRLLKYCKLNVIEVKDVPAPESAGEAQINQILEREGEEVIAKIPFGKGGGSAVIALCVEGKQKSSIEFAESIKKLCIGGVSNITFIIGGSVGLSKKVKSMAGERLSFSEMTFPHQLMRVVLLEQIYRAFKINEGGTYHK